MIGAADMATMVRAAVGDSAEVTVVEPTDDQEGAAVVVRVPGVASLWLGWLYGSWSYLLVRPGAEPVIGEVQIPEDLGVLLCRFLGLPVPYAHALARLRDEADSPTGRREATMALAGDPWAIVRCGRVLAREAKPS